jgi:hypothetical protein
VSRIHLIFCSTYFRWTLNISEHWTLTLYLIQSFIFHGQSIMVNFLHHLICCFSVYGVLTWRADDQWLQQKDVASWRVWRVLWCYTELMTSLEGTMVLYWANDEFGGYYGVIYWANDEFGGYYGVIYWANDEFGGYYGVILS